MRRAHESRRRQLLAAWAAANGLDAPASGTLVGLLGFYGRLLDADADEPTATATEFNVPRSALTRLQACVIDESLAMYARTPTQLVALLASDGATQGISPAMLKRLLNLRPPPEDAAESGAAVASPSEPPSDGVAASAEEDKPMEGSEGGEGEGEDAAVRNDEEVALLDALRPCARL